LRGQHENKRQHTVSSRTAGAALSKLGHQLDLVQCKPDKGRVCHWLVFKRMMPYINCHICCWCADVQGMPVCCTAPLLLPARLLLLQVVLLCLQLPLWLLLQL
jgi:hypothetical protein